MRVNAAEEDGRAERGCESRGGRRVMAMEGEIWILKTGGEDWLVLALAGEKKKEEEEEERKRREGRGAG